MSINIETLIKNLKVNKIDVLSFVDRKECLTYLKANISKEQRISFSGSVSLNECGILNYMREEKFPNLSDRNLPGLTRADKVALDQKAFTADVYLSSVNALTEDGLLVNVDGYGNRVAATIFGPKKVCLVVGKNKLVKNYDAAIQRIKTHAAPLNAKRLGLPTPCAKTGYCVDCLSPNRICSVTAIIKRSMEPGRITVLLVDENLGF